MSVFHKLINLDLHNVAVSFLNNYINYIISNKRMGINAHIKSNKILFFFFFFLVLRVKAHSVNNNINSLTTDIKYIKYQKHFKHLYVRVILSYYQSILSYNFVLAIKY